MPRPRNEKTNVKTKRSGNPISALLAQIQARKQEKQELAAMEVSNDMVKNAQTIVRILKQVDFEQSLLPEKVLEEKSDETLPYGDLYYVPQIVESELKEAPVYITDLREMDTRLIRMAYHFKEGVERGNPRQARYAQRALLRGVGEVRRDVPETQSERADKYVEEMVKYLDQWLIMLEKAAELDAKEAKVQELKANLKATKRKQDEAENDFQVKLRDPSTGYFALVDDMMHLEDTADRSSWSPEQRKIHKAVVELEVRRHSLKFNDAQIENTESECRLLEGHLGMMESIVAGLPNVADPNLLDRYYEEVNSAMKEMFESDARVNEMIKCMEEQEGIIEQLAVAPGAVREFDHAVTEMKHQMKKLEEEQEEMVSAQKRSAELLKKAKIQTNEQLKKQREHEAEMLKKWQEELQRQEQHNQQENVNEEIQQEQQYNEW